MDLQDAIQAVDYFLHDGMGATGKSGFEGLVAVLFQQATGQEFRLASSGRQAGRDAGSEFGTANRIKIEAKHYLATTSLNERDLIGEISQAATSDPLLDVWVLAATRSVSEQIEHSLSNHASTYGVEVIVLDLGISGIPRVCVLMASFPNIVIDFAQRNGLPHRPGDLISALRTIAASPEFRGAQRRLQVKLHAALGYGTARLRNHRLLLRTLSDELSARSTFRQTLGIRVPGTHVVRRSDLTRQLDEWWDDPGHPAAVVLGEEGTGKTWVVFDWLAARISQDSMPLVLPFSAVAQDLTGANPVPNLLPSLLERWSQVRDEQHWKRRLARWLEAEPTAKPLLLLVIDGLNERPNIEWRALLTTLQAPPFGRRIRIIATDRPHHWRSRCSMAGVTDFLEIAVGRYTEAELDDALSSRGLSHKDIPHDLLPLISTPRYCGIAANHYRDMISAADFTRERLIYLEIKDRRRSKENYPLSDDQFFEIVRELAEHARSNPNLRPKDLRALVSVTGGDEGTVYEELITGGLVDPIQNGVTTVLRINPLKLVFGLGMLLADELSKRSSSSSVEISEFLTAWFEPQQDMDLKVDICGSAMFHALFQDDFADRPLSELIRYWLGLRNWADTAQKAFVDYVLRRPEIFVRVAEDFWSSGDDSGAAQEFLGAAFRMHRDNDKLRPLLTRAIERWMGFVHPLGRSFQRYDPNRNAQIRKSLEANGQNLSLPMEEDGAEFTRSAEDRAGCALKPGRIEVAGVPLTVVADGSLLRLARLALLIISDGVRMPFIRSLVNWAMASAVMDEPGFDDSVFWVVRLTDEEIEPVLLSEARFLLARGEPVARTAARFLLLSIGSAESDDLIQRHDLAPSWQRQHHEEHGKDPCKSFYLWTRRECISCLERSDISLHRILERAESLVIDPAETIPASLIERSKEALAEIEPSVIHSGSWPTADSQTLKLLTPILCAYSPQVMASLIRTVVRTMPDRDLAGQYFLAVNLAENSLLLRSAETAAVCCTIDTLLNSSKEWPRDNNDAPIHNKRVAEARALAAVMPHLTPEDLFTRLVKRPDCCLDLTSYELWFAPLASDETAQAIDLLHSSPDEQTLIRILWVLPYLAIPLTEERRSRLVQLAASQNPQVRSGALRAAVQIGDESTGRRIVQLGQFMNKDMNLWEATWLTRLVARFGSEVSFEEIAARLRPSYIGFVLAERGFRENELNIYSECLNREWQIIVGSLEPEIHLLPKVAVSAIANPDEVTPDLWEPSEARRIRLDRSNSWTSGRPIDHANAFKTIFGGDDAEGVRAKNVERRRNVDAILTAWKTDAFQWYGRSFPLNVMDILYQQVPQMLERWVEPAIKDSLAAKAIRVRLGSFLEPICRVLLDRNPSMGLNLWHVLRNDEDNPLVFDTASIAFNSRYSSESESARNIILDESWNDSSLARIAFLATKSLQRDWLERAIEKLVDARQLWRKMKGLALASFSDITPETFEILITRAQVPCTWVEENLAPLRDNVKKNSLARHWYAVFLTSGDDDAAWGALEIVALLADERLLIWDVEVADQHEGSETTQKRIKYFELRWSRKNISEHLSHDRERKERLFGMRFEREEIVPFL